MADDPAGVQQNTTTDPNAPTVGDTSTLIVPDDIAQRFPELIEMIKASRSMNDEERQYWVDALSIMSEDQVKNLYSILDNERKQIQAAEENYKKSMQAGPKKPAVEFDSDAYREKKQQRLEAERQFEEEELKEEESLLEQLAAL